MTERLVKTWFVCGVVVVGVVGGEGVDVVIDDNSSKPNPSGYGQEREHLNHPHHPGVTRRLNSGHLLMSKWERSLLRAAGRGVTLSVVVWYPWRQMRPGKTSRRYRKVILTWISSIISLTEDSTASSSEKQSRSKFAVQSSFVLFLHATRICTCVSINKRGGDSNAKLDRSSHDAGIHSHSFAPKVSSSSKGSPSDS